MILLIKAYLSEFSSSFQMLSQIWDKRITGLLHGNSSKLNRDTESRIIHNRSKFSGFMFKILLIWILVIEINCFYKDLFGKFKQGNNYYHVRNDTKTVSNATAFMAQQKETINEAFGTY